MKKLTAFILIAVTLWASVIAPARAVVPLLFPYAVGSVTTAEGTIALAAVASTVTIGSIITMLAMTSDGNEPASNGSNVAVQIQIDPYTPLTTPDSAKPPAVVDATSQEVTVSTLQRHSRAYGNGTYYQGTACMDAAQALLSAFGPEYKVTGIVSCTLPDSGWGTIVYSRSDGLSNQNNSIEYKSGCLAGSTWNGSACVKTEFICPPGYTLNTGDNKCYVNNPDESQVADARIQLQRTLNNFAQNPNDPDPIPENVLVRPQDIVISTPERTTTVHINPDGTIDFTEITPTPDGNTKVDSLKVSAPTPGQGPEVISRGSETIPGQELGPANPESSVDSPVPPGTGDGNPTAPATGTNVLNLPANLAKTEKQCGYDDEHKCTTDVKASVDKLVNEDPALQGQKDAAQNKLSQLEADADDYQNNSETLLSSLTSDPLNQHGITWEWVPELPSSDCSPVLYGAGSHVYTWDICPVVQKVRDIFGYVLYIVTAIALFHIAIGRKAE